MKPYTTAAKAKGWKLTELAERWGVTKRHMSNVAAKPKQRDWDALEGVPDLKLIALIGDVL